MSYIDLAYYSDTYFGVDAGADFPRLAARASDDIDLATGHSFVFGSLTEPALTLVKKAVCAQVEFYVQNGDTYNETESAGNEQIGSYSRTTGFQQRKSRASLSPRAQAFLEQTGLMFRGVEVLYTATEELDE
jgi:hypothetical protein